MWLGSAGWGDGANRLPTLDTAGLPPPGQLSRAAPGGLALCQLASSSGTSRPIVAASFRSRAALSRASLNSGSRLRSFVYRAPKPWLQWGKLLGPNFASMNQSFSPISRDRENVFPLSRPGSQYGHLCFQAGLVSAEQSAVGLGALLELGEQEGELVCRSVDLDINSESVHHGLS